PQAGLAGKNPFPPLLILGLPPLAVLLEPLEGQAHHLSVIRHRSSPPVPMQLLHISAHLRLRVPGGLLVPPAGRRAVPRLNLLHRVEARLVPLLQNAVAIGPLQLMALQHRFVIGQGHGLRAKAHLLPGEDVLLLRRRGGPVPQL
ncbi:3-hydroxyacyl-ACP dehydratase FabZ, partial [Dysosmobacter welbionis]